MKRPYQISLIWAQKGVCFSRWPLLTNGIANLMLDVLVLALPVTMVWRLRMELRQKLALSGIFALGGL